MTACTCHDPGAFGHHCDRDGKPLPGYQLLDWELGELRDPAPRPEPESDLAGALDALFRRFRRSARDGAR